MVAVTAVLPVVVTDVSPAITAFLRRILATGVNSCIWEGRCFDDFAIHLQFQSLLLAMMVADAESGSQSENSIPEPLSFSLFPLPVVCQQDFQKLFG